jgi:hypothetical protein
MDASHLRVLNDKVDNLTKRIDLLAEVVLLLQEAVGKKSPFTFNTPVHATQIGALPDEPGYINPFAHYSIEELERIMRENAKLQRPKNTGLTFIG